MSPPTMQQPTTIVDQAARERIRTSLDESLLVEAAAGTGKTTELVHRLVTVIAEGRARRGMAGIVAVTFTRKAAGELKLRLRHELDRARLAARDSGDGEDPERLFHLEDAIQRLEEAHVGTIHSFCAELLRERPVEAGVDPAFEGLSEAEAPRLFAEAFQAWVEEALEMMPEGIRRALSRLATGSSWGPQTPLDRLRAAAWELAEWRDFPAAWRRPDVDLRLEIDARVEEILELAELARRCPDPRDYLRRSLEPVETLAGWIERVEAVGERDYDELEARLVHLLSALRRLRWKGRGRFADGVSRAEVIGRRDELRERLEQLREAADADLAALLQGELEGLLQRYAAIKSRRGGLDFVDLLIRTRDLLRGNAEVRGFFQESFTHIFVDEFQDTDPLQTEILLLLSADDRAQGDWRCVRPRAGKLFLVGDPKQSIYRFRRADVLLYQEVKETLRRRDVGLVELRQSFRATAPIQAAINQAFGSAMEADEEHGQPRYIPLAPARRRPGGQPAVVALPASRPYGMFRVSRMQIESVLPEEVVGFVDWLLNESDWTVEDPLDGGCRRVAPDDVCILFRRYLSWWRDVTRPYVRSLEARGIPHVLVGARTFHQREEVETLRAALTAVEWPEDELAVFATLRGALFSIGDEELLLFRERFPLHPFRARRTEADEEDRSRFQSVFAALDTLADLHRRRNRRPVVETLEELLGLTRAHAAFALRPAGSQVLANVQRVCDLARAYELEAGGISFRGFVERLESEAEQPASTQAPVVEEGAPGVRLMTVHAAKGLEFPVVVLADMTAGLARDSPDKHVDPERRLCATRLLGCAPEELVENAELERERDRAEGVRIAYVAATRARDLLVVPAVGDEPLDGWLSPLHGAIYPQGEARREAAAAPGCPPFGPVSVLSRPQEHDGRPERSVRPGLHRLEGGADHQVVWWDPATLPPKPAENFGLRQVEILAEDTRGEEKRGVDRYREWREGRERMLEQGRAKTHEVLVVSELEEGPGGPQRRIDFDRIEREAGRPAGARFGTLVHTLLRDVPLAAQRDEIERLARLHAVLLDSPSEEVAAAAVAVEATLAHPVFERVRRAAREGRCFRESPFIVPLSDERLLEGTMDLALREAAGWLVVDYKTDADVESRRSLYEVQLAWYLFALETLYDEPVAGLLLAV